MTPGTTTSWPWRRTTLVVSTVAITHSRWASTANSPWARSRRRRKGIITNMSSCLRSRKVVKTSAPAWRSKEQVTWVQRNHPPSRWKKEKKSLWPTSKSYNLFTTNRTGTPMQISTLRGSWKRDRRDYLTMKLNMFLISLKSTGWRISNSRWSCRRVTWRSWSNLEHFLSKITAKSLKEGVVSTLLRDTSRSWRLRRI